MHHDVPSGVKGRAGEGTGRESHVRPAFIGRGERIPFHTLRAQRVRLLLCLLAPHSAESYVVSAPGLLSRVLV